MQFLIGFVIGGVLFLLRNTNPFFATLWNIVTKIANAVMWVLLFCFVIAGLKSLFKK